MKHLAARLTKHAEQLFEAGLENIATDLREIANLLITESAMGIYADAIHKLQQQLVTEKAATTTAQADAAKFKADSDTLASLRAGGFIADQTDHDAAVQENADTSGGSASGDSVISGAGNDSVVGA